jgi:hypothetical protein
MERFMVYGINSTPYAALIRNVSATVEALPDEDPADDYALERWTFTATVLETYRGVSMKSLRYTVDTEKGEEPNFAETPFIILLCRTADGYFWPGVGFNFDGGERERKIARSAAKEAGNEQKSFVECDG